MLGSRGFLSNYPPDVIAVINGQPITKQDKLDYKRSRQQRELSLKRRINEEIKPCFIWTFYNDTFICGGWWLYVRTVRYSWCITDRSCHRRFIIPIMRMFPCGYLPMIENLNPWMSAFANAYHYPTPKRPSRQGMVTARARVSASGRLLDVFKEAI